MRCLRSFGREPIASQDFYRLRLAGLVVGETSADARPRFLYERYLSARLRRENGAGETPVEFLLASRTARMIGGEFGATRLLEREQHAVIAGSSRDNLGHCGARHQFVINTF